MAFLRRGIGDNSGIESVSLSTGLLQTVRWFAIPCAGDCIASWCRGALAGLHSAASLAYSGSSRVGRCRSQPQLRQSPRQPSRGEPRNTVIAPVEKSARLATLSSDAGETETRSDCKAAGRSVRQGRPRGKSVARKTARRLRPRRHGDRNGRRGGSRDRRSRSLALPMPSAERFHRAATNRRSRTRCRVQPADAELDPLLLSSARPDRPAMPSLPTRQSKRPRQSRRARAGLACRRSIRHGRDEAGTGEDYMPDAVELPPAKPDAKPAGKPNAAPKRRREPARKPARPQTAEPQQNWPMRGPTSLRPSGPFKTSSTRRRPATASRSTTSRRPWSTCPTAPSSRHIRASARWPTIRATCM